MLVSSVSVVAQDVPVIELGGSLAQPAVRASSVQPVIGSVPELKIQPVNNTAPSPLSGYNVASGYGNNSEMLILVQQLQDEVRTLRGQLESQARKITRMEAEQRDRYRDLDHRIGYLMKDQESRRSSASNAGAGVAGVSGRVESGVQSSASVSVPVTGKNGDVAAYQAAFSLVRQRAYAEAVAAFGAFVRDYPGSSRVANAYYWLGEIYLTQQKLELARDSFAKVVALFSDHRKAADATYKLGKVYAELGDKEKSAEYMDLVLKNYPESSASRLARDFRSQ